MRNLDTYVRRMYGLRYTDDPFVPTRTVSVFMGLTDEIIFSRKLSLYELTSTAGFAWVKDELLSAWKERHASAADKQQMRFGSAKAQVRLLASKDGEVDVDLLDGAPMRDKYDQGWEVRAIFSLVEYRFAWDGKRYNKQQFFQYYGAFLAEKRWRDAKDWDWGSNMLTDSDALAYSFIEKKKRESAHARPQTWSMSATASDSPPNFLPGSPREAVWWSEASDSSESFTE